MGCSSTVGTSSGSPLMQNSGSDQEDLQALMDQRKRKRKISNCESARRSRMKKQKHLDDLTAQVSQLRYENHRIITSMNITTEHYLNIESENSVLRAQMDELSHRLESLNEIISFLCSNGSNGVHGGELSDAFSTHEPIIESLFIDNPLNNMGYLNQQQPIMASADVFDQF